VSLYNALFGVNPASEVIMASIGVSMNDVPRFRDVYLHQGHIVIHTRTGGGNREYYDEPNVDNPDGPWNSTLRDNKYYIRDEDDDFDSTYADFYFRYPEGLEDDYKALADGNKAHTPSEKWKLLFEQLSSPQPSPNAAANE
jgi:hypothetical protein